MAAELPVTVEPGRGAGLAEIVALAVDAVAEAERRGVHGRDLLLRHQRLDDAPGPLPVAVRVVPDLSGEPPGDRPLTVEIVETGLALRLSAGIPSDKASGICDLQRIGDRFLNAVRRLPSRASA
jgi:hypothetical protein